MSIWRARSIASTIARCGASCGTSSPRPATSRGDDNFPHLVKGKQARIADRPPLIYHFTAKGDARHHVDARRAFDVYVRRLSPDRLCLLDRYALKDIAFKVVGVGSVGTFCAIGLYMCGDGTPLFLQIKEAGKSVLERLATKFDGHQGQRVVEGQRVMQAASDVFLGWTRTCVASSVLCAPTEEQTARFDRRAGRGARRLQAMHSCAGVRSRAPMRARRTRPPWQATWERAAFSTMRWRHLRWPMRCARHDYDQLVKAKRGVSARRLDRLGDRS